MHDDAGHRSSNPSSAALFVRHLGEMLLAMLVGMTVLGFVDSRALEAVGLGAIRQQPLADLALMSVEMTVPMALWMRRRAHAARDVLEMSASMVVPAVVLIGVGGLGVMTAMDAEMTYHPVMLAAMVGLMLARRDVYAAHHHAVHPGREPSPQEMPGPDEVRPGRSDASDRPEAAGLAPLAR